MSCATRQDDDREGAGLLTRDSPRSPPPIGKLKGDGLEGVLHAQVPYVSLPYPLTHPSRLAAAVALHGAPAPPPATSRVLEIGCASGGNIVPLAERFPNASFVGIDLAQRHVDMANARIARLGLTNIDVHCADVSLVNLENRTFDYIVCHGVFSWAPPEAQKAILRICGERLSPTGVALVSYNVLPGWRLRSVVRDICLRHAGDGPATDRISRARAALAAIASATEVESAYHRLLRQEARRLANRPGAYILGEFLAADNTPYSFAAFAEQATANGLRYICDASLRSEVAPSKNIRTSALNDLLTGADLVAREAISDEISGRCFRSSVLRRTSVERTEPNRESLTTLHVRAGTGLDALQEDAIEVSAAFHRVRTADPDTVSVSELLSVTPPERHRILLDRLLQLAMECRIEVHAEAVVADQQDTLEPRLSKLARLEASENQPWMTNLAHQPVRSPPANKVLAPLLDGRNGRAALIARLDEALTRGEVPREALRGSESDHAAAYVERYLSYLQRNALLLPPEPAAS